MEFQRHPREYFQNSNPIPFPPPNNNNMMLMNNNTNNNNNNNNNFNTNLTLIVKHLPEAIPFDTLMRLFSHYGASAVRPCSAGRLKNCAFVDFKDEASASRAESQLNRLRFLGKVLVVERAKPIPTANQSKQPNRTDSIPAPIPVHSVKNEDKAGGKDAMHVDQSSSVAEPIAPKLGIDYPFPPHLEYAYPPPDGNILTNIVNALIAVPRFYTQVLHLMNKMNLPAPFGPALPTPPLPSSTPPIPVPSGPQPDENDLSTDESELESSDEEEPEGGNMTSGGKYIPKSKKRKLKQQKLDPSLENRTSTQTVTVKPASLLPKEVPTLKKKQPVLQIKITPKGLNSEGIKNNREDASSSIEKSKEKSEMKCATIEELQAGKMHPSEILSLPMFKNYAPGNPALVLYIKNLAKDVVADDLYYVFGSLFKGASEAKAVLGVKLMQEGRMRGQAFVTFPSVDLADHALKMAHGFILKGKPMIIQFGRNPSSSKAD